jgi:CheY-like chemotaxis protein
LKGEAVKRPVLLIVDDDLDVRTMVRVALETHGLEVLEAADGNTAWDLILAQHPRVVVADVHMPGMTGLELCRKVKAHGTALGDVKVVVYTAGMATKQEAEAAGCDGYFLKTVPLGEIRATVKRYTA